jgi:hypothetical protein
MRFAAFGGSGYKKPSRASPFVGFSPPHFCGCDKGTLRVPLSQPQKRRIQPERYATIGFEIVDKK